VTTAGSVVTAWADQSGNGNNGTPSGSPTLTTNDINGRPGVTFVKASSQYVAFPNNFGSLTAAEIFIVVKSTTTDAGLHNFGNSAGAQQLYPWSDNHVYENFASNARSDTGDPTPDLTAYHLYNVRSSAIVFSSFINAAQQFSTGTNTVAWGAGPAVGGSAGTGAATPTSFFSGGIASVVLYNRVLSNSERIDYHKYIFTRFGLAVT
jgi:hypothetical protein